MAVGAFTSLGTTTAIDTAADVTLTLSGAIPTGALAFCAVHIGKNDGVSPVAPTSVTGGGVTWDLETSFAYDTTGTPRGALYIYRAYASAPSGTSVVVDLAATAQQVLVGVGYVTGAISGSNGASAIVQELTAAATTLNASTLTDTTNNAFIGFGAWNSTAARTATPDSDPAMAEVWDVTAQSADLRRAAFFSQYVVGTAAVNPTINYTLSGAVDASASVVYEIAALVGPSITVQPANDVGIISNGDSTVYTATATGTNVQAPTWSVDATPISDGGIYDIATTGAGTSSCTSTLTITRTSKTGTPFDIVANFADDNGDTDTNTVTDTWWTGPEVTTFAPTDSNGESTATLTCDYVTGVGEAIEVAIVLPDGRVSVTTTTTA